MKKPFAPTLIASALLVLCTTASAQLTLRVGGTHIQPNSSATQATGPMLPNPSGVSLKVEDAATLTAAVSYAVTPNFEAELILGVPPRHNSTAQLSGNLPSGVMALNGQTIASVAQIAPTAFVNYRLGDSSWRWRPFVGLGVNYTKFSNPQVTAAGVALNGGPTSVSMTDSWGLAGQAGVSYQLSPRWSVQGSLATAQVKSTLTTQTAGVSRVIDVRYKPLVTTLSAGYSF